MTEAAKPPVSPEADADMVAIRSLIEEADVDTVKVGSESSEAEVETPRRRKLGLLPIIEPPEPGSVEMSKAGLIARYIVLQIRAIVSILWRRIKTYRPERKKILVTAFFGLLLLRPGIVLGWIFLGLVVLTLYYCVIGGDRFWQRILSGYQAWERRWPTSAHKFESRISRSANKWNRFVEKLPDRMADALRFPELGLLIRADEEHDATMSTRLDQLMQKSAF